MFIYFFRYLFFAIFNKRFSLLRTKRPREQETQRRRDQKKGAKGKKVCILARETTTYPFMDSCILGFTYTNKKAKGKEVSLLLRTHYLFRVEGEVSLAPKGIMAERKKGYLFSLRLLVCIRKTKNKAGAFLSAIISLG